MIAVGFPTEGTFCSCGVLTEETFDSCGVLTEETFDCCGVLTEETFDCCGVLTEGTFDSCGVLTEETFDCCGVLTEETIDSCGVLKKRGPYYVFLGSHQPSYRGKAMLTSQVFALNMGPVLEMTVLKRKSHEAEERICLSMCAAT